MDAPLGSLKYSRSARARLVERDADACHLVVACKISMPCPFRFWAAEVLNRQATFYTRAASFPRSASKEDRQLEMELRGDPIPQGRLPQAHLASRCRTLT